jgi:hypothetical protein
MALPMPPNTTCDIYRTGHTPPAAPDVPGVKCYLAPKGQSTLTTPQSSGVAGGYSHIMYVGPTTDIRDGTGSASLQPASPDSVWIPDKNNVQYQVQLVRRVGMGTPTDHKQVLLRRMIVTWPNDNV